MFKPFSIYFMVFAFLIDKNKRTVVNFTEMYHLVCSWFFTNRVFVNLCRKFYSNYEIECIILRWPWTLFNNLIGTNAVYLFINITALLEINSKISHREQSKTCGTVHLIYFFQLCTSATFSRQAMYLKAVTTFVEATYNKEWGYGLNRDGTSNTKPDHWPGKNKLGVLMKNKSLKMLQRLRATSDSDMSGCNPDSYSSGDKR